jgi:ribosomal protein S14
MARERSEEQRRRDAEEEEHHYWEMQEAERLEAEQKEEEKASAIETMENWFHENFEDPQNQMPWDNEDQKYIYPYGGPYEPQDILHDTFKTEFDAAWIVEAAERITDAGTFEWAPSSNSEYYEHPDPEDEDETLEIGSPQAAALTRDILDRLEQLEGVVAALLPVRPVWATTIPLTTSASRPILTRTPAKSPRRSQRRARRWKRRRPILSKWRACRHDLRRYARKSALGLPRKAISPSTSSLNIRSRR